MQKKESPIIINSVCACMPSLSPCGDGAGLLIILGGGRNFSLKAGLLERLVDNNFFI